MRIRTLALAVAAVALSACGIAAPLPVVDAPAPGVHHDMLVMGDSLLAQTVGTQWTPGPPVDESDPGDPEPGPPTPLADRMEALGMDVTIHNRTRNGSGLLSDHPDGLTPREQLTDILAELADAGTPPTVVVFEYSGNSLLVTEPAYGSDQWFVAWWAEAQAMVELAAASGAAVYWTAPPPFLDPVRQRVAWESNLFVAANPGLGHVDWWTALASVGCRTWVNNRWIELCYADELWYSWDDTIHPVRTEDRLHLTPDGLERTAWWLVATVAPEWQPSV